MDSNELSFGAICKAVERADNLVFEKRPCLAVAERPDHGDLYRIPVHSQRRCIHQPRCRPSSTSGWNSAWARIEFWPQKPMPQLPSQPVSMSAPVFMPASESAPMYDSRARSAKHLPGCFLKAVV